MSGRNALPRTAAVVVAAGQGLRAGQPVPKQFALWRGKPVVRHSVEALRNAGISPIVVAVPPGAQDVATAALEGLGGVRLVSGGQTRQESVLRGLEALQGDGPDLVLIHDAARPILPASVLDRLQAALAVHAAAIPVLPVSDSLAEENDGMMGTPTDRDRLRRVQTPQAFHFDAILAAHRGWSGAPEAGDDAQVARKAGVDVAFVEGDEALHKLTFASDFAVAAPTVRIGTGYDVHRLADGEELWLGGIKIKHSQGLAGHSDADVAIHALVDALLGAVGSGDIGQHFPPSDPQWRGASSDRFLIEAVRLVAEAGYAVGNIDLTIICEMPKIGPYREAMRERIASLLGVDIDAVSVKATTTEKLGFTGRGEGIAAQAVASVFRS
ncbi:MAG: bifunctional 2-C-methyl-D-erythritol 4-phosphate cytidylyltransferase/2-C-methyl-D-erythritol 2,4-cyclodiphosphate synthase [Novosphingobium sp.]|nr:bifunctional 2-C-methyl-D-erythritol 4-phosphate cytidylyltransferase/2-C-methyl-D-erythritol 2,4-cyclodiphosphate synthase [Novosphingobium sp.]MCP5402628.1 bifunctional 2-C-methyl-D-erythritol 4-phosphate cytidylyltransferase/2-C-methyl-D-erythritol 2,4-cyclodiphosphate synthase [Novosphingobium sp.]